MNTSDRKERLLKTIKGRKETLAFWAQAKERAKIELARCEQQYQWAQLRLAVATGELAELVTREGGAR